MWLKRAVVVFLNYCFGGLELTIRQGRVQTCEGGSGVERLTRALESCARVVCEEGVTDRHTVNIRARH